MSATSVQKERKKSFLFDEENISFLVFHPFTLFPERVSMGGKG
jgi:hypothetical protein